MSDWEVLDGVRVLDLSQGAAGPTAAMILGEYGADVIKIEPPEGDWGRRLGPPFLGDDAAAYWGMNRNKRSLVVDLKAPRGREIVRALARTADVVLESYRPGVADRLGVGYESLARERPELIYCAISAFGTTGPWRDKPGVDGIVQAMSGIMSITGEPTGQPVKVGVPAADMTGALVAVQGILLALLARERTGRGQRVDVSLMDSLFFFQTVPWSMFLVSGRSPGRLGSAAPYSAPNEVYPTRDGFLMVAAYWPERWQRLTAILGCPELATDPRFSDMAGRVTHRAELFTELAERFRQRTTAEWTALLEEQDILCAPLLGYEQLAAMEHVMTPERFPRVSHALVGPTPGVGMPARLLAQPPRPKRPAPLLGEHTREILLEAGLDSATIADLEHARVVWQRGDQVAESERRVPAGAGAQETAAGPGREGRSITSSQA